MDINASDEEDFSVAFVDSMDGASDEEDEASVEDYFSVAAVDSERRTRAQLEASGIQTSSQKERRIYCVVAYRERFE